MTAKECAGSSMALVNLSNEQLRKLEALLGEKIIVDELAELREDQSAEAVIRRNQLPATSRREPCATCGAVHDPEHMECLCGNCGQVAEIVSGTATISHGKITGGMCRPCAARQCWSSQGPDVARFLYPDIFPDPSLKEKMPWD